MIRLTESIGSVKLRALQGFAEHWHEPVTSYELMQLLRGSDKIVLAIEEPNQRVVGISAALADGSFFGLITLLAVREGYDARVLEERLLRRAPKQLSSCRKIERLVWPTSSAYDSTLPILKAA